MSSTLNYLFLILPGMGGSKLACASSGDREIVWSGLGSAAKGLFVPDRLAVSDDDGIVPIGAIEDWKIGPLGLVRGYGGLIKTISQLANEPNPDLGDPLREDLTARVAVVPYDFRKGIDLAAEALADNAQRRLAALGWSKSQGKKIVVVAHSMGGLVARYWAGPLGGHEHCRAMVTLGTPHRGAPRALEVLHDGVRFRRIAIPGGFSDLLRSFDGVHDLLPRYPMVQKGGNDHYPKDVPVPGLNSSKAVDSFERHLAIERAWENLDPHYRTPILPVVGVGLSTTESASLVDGRLTFSKAAPNSVVSAAPDSATFRGDGTVPNISALPIELDNAQGRISRRPSIGGAHGELVDFDALEQLIVYQLSEDLGHQIRDAAPTSKLVIDYDEAVPVGHEGVGRILSYSLGTDEQTLDSSPTGSSGNMQVRVGSQDWVDAEPVPGKFGQWTFPIAVSAPGRHMITASSNRTPATAGAEADCNILASREILAVDFERLHG